MTMTSDVLDFLEARGLDPEVGDRLGFDGRRGRDGTDELVISFRREGKVVRRKYRPLEQREGQPRFYQDKGGIRCLWNEDCLRDPALFGQPLIITEGEMDAWAAIQCGYPKTVSVPDGAPPPAKEGREDDEDRGSVKYAWIDEVASLLTRERVPEIILATDDDENGHQLLHDLSHRLGRFRCKHLIYPKATVAYQAEQSRDRLKDLNDVLAVYGAKGLQQTVANAQFCKVSGVYTLGTLPPRPTPKILDIQFDRYGSHYRMRMGDFVVVTGVPSSGKTTFIQDLVCRVVLRHQTKVAWASFEQDPLIDHRRNFRRWYNSKPVVQQTVEEKRNADEWIERYHTFIVPDEEEDATLEWLLEKMETAVLRHGAEIIVLDPWNEMDHLRERHENLTEYVGRAIKTLIRFAKRLQVHLIVVAHPSKMQRDKQSGTYPEPSLYDISDSAHWYNKAVLGVVVHRINRDQTKVKTAKSKYHDVIGSPGSVIMEFCKDDGRFREIEGGD